MRRFEAIRIARRIERCLERQCELAWELKAAAEEGCPIAAAAFAAVENECLPHPLTAVENCVREAVAKAEDGPR